MYPIIYTRNNCPGCDMLKETLRLRGGGLRYTMKNIDTDPRARAELFATGSQSVPTAVINGNTVIGAFEIQRVLGI